MSSPNLIKNNSRNNKTLEINDINYLKSSNSSKDLFSKMNYNNNNNDIFSKLTLRRELSGKLNKSNIITGEPFIGLQMKFHFSKLFKSKKNKKIINRPNILIYPNISNKLDDDNIRLRDLFNKKFKSKGKRKISFPQLFQSNSNDKRNANEKLKIISRNRMEDINYKYPKSSIKSDKYDIIHNHNTIDYHNEDDNNYNNIRKEGFNSKKNMNWELPLIKDDNYFHKNKEKKYKFLSEVNENKIAEKFEKMKKRKEQIILNNIKKMKMMKEKNNKKQIKKEDERFRRYLEKKFIKNMVDKLRKNYININCNIGDEIKDEKKNNKRIEYNVSK